MKALLIGFWDPFLLELTERLIAKGLDVRTMVGYETKNYRVRPALANVEVIDNKRFYYPEEIRKLNAGHAPRLSAADYAAYSAVIRDFLTYTDRLSFFAKTIRFRRLLAQELLEYWNRFFDERKFDVVIMDAAPHMGWDNLLHAVAIRKGLPIRHLQLSTVANRVLVLESFKDLPKVPEAYLAGIGTKEIEARLPNDLREDLNKVSPWLAYSVELNDQVVGRGRRPRLPSIRSAFRSLRQRAGRTVHAARIGLKPFDLSAFYLNGSFRYFSLMAVMWFFYREKKALKAHYESLTDEIDQTRDYGVYAMHYQPEMASSTITNGFDDQVLAIEILSAALPDGWFLYVKEHPAQFLTGMRSATTRHYRDTQDYDRIKALRNVKLVPLGKDSRELIRDARFVSTLTGTMAWEAMENGKPAIVFGDPPYVGCGACYRVADVSEASRAIHEIRSKSADDVRREVLRYVAFLGEKLIQSADTEAYANRSPIPRRIQLENLSSAFIREAESATEKA